jgi:hypothetical protein
MVQIDRLESFVKDELLSKKDSSDYDNQPIGSAMVAFDHPGPFVQEEVLAQIDSCEIQPSYVQQKKDQTNGLDIIPNDVQDVQEERILSYRFVSPVDREFQLQFFASKRKILSSRRIFVVAMCVIFFSIILNKR